VWEVNFLRPWMSASIFILSLNLLDSFIGWIITGWEKKELQVGNNFLSEFWIFRGWWSGSSGRTPA
jgi:hypothetical protein